MRLNTVVASMVVAGFCFSSATMAATTTKVANAGTGGSKLYKSLKVLNQQTAYGVGKYNWEKRLSVGGLMNVDAIWSNDDPAGAFNDNENSSDFVLSNANLFFDAKIAPMVVAHANLMYHAYWNNSFTLTNGGTVNYTDITPRDLRIRSYELTMDEAYVTIGDLAKNPFYFRAGKEYVPFGHYSLYPVVKSFTQELSETNAVAAETGVITDFGFYGKAYAFNEQNKKSNVNAFNIRNFGVKIGYSGSLRPMGVKGGYNVNGSWIRNIYGIDALKGYSYTSHVGGYSAHADVYSGPFSLAVNYVTAADKLAASNADDTKAYAGDVTARYGFNTYGRKSSVGIGYQWTGDAEGNGGADGTTITAIEANYNQNGYLFNGTQKRWVADYKVRLYKNTDLTLAGVYNKAYSTGFGSSVSYADRNNTVGIARLTVKF